MIVKLSILTKEDKEIVMLFGNSYKNWYTQFREWCIYRKPKQLNFAQSSPEKWKSWGGLKWCEESDFQEELNREGCQQNDPDNPNPRQYKNMRFVDNRIVRNIVNKTICEINEWEAKRQNEQTNQ